MKSLGERAYHLGEEPEIRTIRFLWSGIFSLALGYNFFELVWFRMH
jgi:hypothetical protein